MKLGKMLFWRRNKSRSKRTEENGNDVEDGSEAASTSEENKSRPRSASFSGVGDVTVQKEKETKTSKKAKRSVSMGHKTSRRNSFIRWYRRSKDIGKALRQIGDNLESSHSNSSLNVSSR